MRPARRVRALASLAVLVAACATPAGPVAVVDLAPDQHPGRGTDEAGLWMQADLLEETLRAAPQVVHDAGLHEYVRGVVCRVAGPHCPGLRVYVVRNPAFHAAMAPNGMMQVATGLLLRVASEAQLAYVAGHEIGHYLRRHTLRRWSDVTAGLVPRTREHISAFSREQEREADQIGFDLMTRAGYDPREAPRAWDRLTAEQAVVPGSVPEPFLATHPVPAERVAVLRAFAERAVADGAPRVGHEEHVRRLRPIRGALLRDEIQRRPFAASEALLRRLESDGDGRGEVHFYLGEIHRRRAAVGDLTRAVAAYEQALTFPDAPPETLRSLGIVRRRLEAYAAAREAFARYLERRPDAEDRELIRQQIADLERAR